MSSTKLEEVVVHTIGKGPIESVHVYYVEALLPVSAMDAAAEPP
jgi:hypothetical protein